MKPPSAKGRQIECPDFFGHKRSYAADTVRFRPAGYGILEHGGKILLGRSRFTGLWDFPGGGVEPFELMADGMAREFYEETGLSIAPQDLVYVAEGYIAMFGRPFHSLRFYYRCRLDGSDPAQLNPDMGELSQLLWWQREDIPNDQMHASDRTALTRFLHEIS